MGKTSGKRRAWSPESQGIYTRLRIERACAENRLTLRAFAEWLVEERCLAPGTITVRLGTACSFVDAITDRAKVPCAQAFESLTPSGVEDFFIRYGKGHGASARRSMQAAMRLFLKFAYSLGWVDRELVDAVPSLPSYRLSGLPRNDYRLKRA